MTIDDQELDELLGKGSAKADQPARPRTKLTAQAAEDRLADLAEKAAIKRAGGGYAFVSPGELRKPVSQNFLCQVFDMDPKTVRKRLEKCPHLGLAGGGRPIYDFKTAVGYLIKPTMNISDYIKTLDPARLPNHINKVYWEARRTRLKYMLESGDAWRAEDVLSLLGEVAMTIKDQHQLWIETMRERAGLTDEQMVRLTQLVDELQGKIHSKLVEIPTKRKTLSMMYESDGDTLPVSEFKDEDEAEFG